MSKRERPGISSLCSPNTDIGSVRGICYWLDLLKDISGIDSGLRASNSNSNFKIFVIAYDLLHRLTKKSILPLLNLQKKLILLSDSYDDQLNIIVHSTHKFIKKKTKCFIFFVVFWANYCFLHGKKSHVSLLIYWTTLRLILYWKNPL